MDLCERLTKAVHEKRYITNYKINLAIVLSSKSKQDLHNELLNKVNCFGNIYNGQAKFMDLPMYESEQQKEEFIIIQKL